jgi:hypothetical protein
VQALHDLDERLLDGILSKVTISKDPVPQGVHAVRELAK